MVKVRFFNAIEMSSKSIIYPQQGLSNILDSTLLAGYATNEVRASARDVFQSGMFLSSHKTHDTERIHVNITHYMLMNSQLF